MKILNDDTDWNNLLKSSSSKEIRILVCQIAMLINTSIKRGKHKVTKNLTQHIFRIARILRETNRDWILKDIIES